MTTQNNKDIETNIALIKKDVDNFTQLFGKIDITLEKMSEVSNSVGRLLSLHEQRLDTLHEADRVLEVKLEKNSIIFSEEIKELHEHIRHTNRDLISKLKESEDAIKADIKQVKEAVDKENKNIQRNIETTNINLDKTNKRLDALERWKWIVIGGSVIVTWLISKLPISFLIS